MDKKKIIKNVKTVHTLLHIHVADTVEWSNSIILKGNNVIFIYLFFCFDLSRFDW